MTSLEQELREQPEVVARLLDATWPRLPELREALLGSAPDGVVLVARGSSDNAARYAQYLWGLRLGIPVTLATPSLASVYGRRLDLARHAVVAVSQSGASPDVVGVVEQARASGAPTLAVTNDTGSPLASAAEHVLDLGAGPERSVAATKTYTASLLAVALLGVALGEQRHRDQDHADLERVPDAMRAAIDNTHGVSEAVRLVEPHHRAVCVGRGLNLATAHETALKLTELTGTLVAPYSPADLMHGPVAAVGPEVPVVALAPDEPASASVLDIVSELRRRGAPVLVVSPEGATSGCVGTSRVTLPAAAAVADWLTPLVTVVAGQLLAWRLAQARGVDVDRPGELSKVTRTR
ncbi:MAG: SIS domain-containing protein [Nocardioidaceae bacterium]